VPGQNLATMRKDHALESLFWPRESEWLQLSLIANDISEMDRSFSINMHVLEYSQSDLAMNLMPCQHPLENVVCG